MPGLQRWTVESDSPKTKVTPGCFNFSGHKPTGSISICLGTTVEYDAVRWKTQCDMLEFNLIHTVIIWGFKTPLYVV